ncbi:MAG: TonB-dependent receptor [Pseudomonadales bacterium]|nr:TonB-dependent receptor [Gammaproteobacteria bacterium]NNL56764.1 TonB-dependent receptor [Pseudomonadales bacterium]
MALSAATDNTPRATGKNFCIPRRTTFLLCCLACIGYVAPATSDALEEIIVEAALLPTNSSESSHGITLLDAASIAQSHSVFIDELLTRAPNVNFASGASRGRFFQIRGSGERSQFVDPIAPSVGFIVDGIDFSTAANIGALYDIDRVEILRGPQGTVFGSSASAGLINIVSKAPTADTEVLANTSIGAVDGNDGSVDSYEAGLVVNGALSDNANARLALLRHSNDGFANNTFLQRDDTDNIDETVARGKLNWRASDTLQIDTTLLYSDADNGYDAFSLDNVRDTISDQPGHDRQRSAASHIRASYSMAHAGMLLTELALSKDDIDYGYDEDWSNPTLCAPPTICPFGDYSSFDRYLRERELGTLDLRYLPTSAGAQDWTLGLYLNQQQTDLQRLYTFAADFDSRYQTRSVAAYGELRHAQTAHLELAAGLRVENFAGDYDDSLGEAIDPDETLWGGQLSANYSVSNSTGVFVRLSRGFKAAGVNANGAGNLQARFKTFDTETLHNIELGANIADPAGHYRGQLTAFYQQRDDAQIKQSQVTPVSGNSCPCTFDDFTSNANQTEHYGVEFEAQYRVTPALTLDASAGYLHARFSDYQRISEGAGGSEVVENLNGRQVAQAPEYQFSLAGTLALTPQLSLWLNVEGRDRFFFSNRHELKAKAYELFNASLTYTQLQWQLALWGKNLLDTNTHVRGFGSFGNDPRKSYATEPYIQFGMPAEYGVAAQYRFK